MKQPFLVITIDTHQRGRAHPCEKVMVLLVSNLIEIIRYQQIMFDMFEKIY